MKKSILASEIKKGMVIDKAVDHPIFSVHNVSKETDLLFNRMNVVVLGSSALLVKYAFNAKVVILT